MKVSLSRLSLEIPTQKALGTRSLDSHFLYFFVMRLTVVLRSSSLGVDGRGLGQGGGLMATPSSP